MRCIHATYCDATQQLSPGMWRSARVDAGENAAGPGRGGCRGVHQVFACPTVCGLAVLILVFGPVAGAHFNPAVSAADWLLGRRHGTGLTGRDLGGYLAAQTIGAVLGPAFANAMFGQPALQISTHHRLASGHLLGEVVATAGLIAVVFALARTGRAALSAAAVAAYIGAAYWFTSSTSFANPAVTIGRVFTDTFAGIAPHLRAGIHHRPNPRRTPGPGTDHHPLPDHRGRRRQRRRPPQHHHADRHRLKGPPRQCRAHPACCSSASTTPDAPKWPKPSSPTSPETPSKSAPPAPHPPNNSTPPRSKPCEKSVSTFTAQAPKILTPDAVETSTVVITMGCGDTRPYFPGVDYRDWKIDDPAGKDLHTVRAIRDEIRTRVEELLTQLLPQPRPTA